VIFVIEAAIIVFACVHIYKIYAKICTFIYVYIKKGVEHVHGYYNPLPAVMINVK